MVRLRAEKVKKIEEFIPLAKPEGSKSAPVSYTEVNEEKGPAGKKARIGK